MKKKPVRNNNKKRGPEKSNMRKMAEQAGMSRYQMYRALAIASIPEDEFEKLIESDNVPTLTELEEIATKKKKPATTRLKVCPSCGCDLTAYSKKNKKL